MQSAPVTLVKRHYNQYFCSSSSSSKTLIDINSLPLMTPSHYSFISSQSCSLYVHNFKLT